MWSMMVVGTVPGRAPHPFKSGKERSVGVPVVIGKEEEVEVERGEEVEIGAASGGQAVTEVEIGGRAGTEIVTEVGTEEAETEVETVKRAVATGVEAAIKTEDEVGAETREIMLIKISQMLQKKSE